MNEILETIGEQPVAGFMLTLCRISPLFLLAPLFSSRQFPARARGICAVALAIGLAPLARGTTELPLDAIGLGTLALKEVLVGVAFAFSIGAIFAAVSVAGSYLDTMIGFSFGAVVDPLTGSQSSVLMQVYGLVAVAVFIAIGGDGWVIQGLARTYELVPIDRSPALGSMVEGAQQAFVTMFASAIEVAAPVLLAIVLTDAAFGMVSRVVPQLNVFAVGFPAKVAVGLVVLGVSLPFAAEWLSDELQASVSHVLRSLKVDG